MDFGLDSIARQVQEELKTSKKTPKAYTEAMTQYRDFLSTGNCTCKYCQQVFRLASDETMREVVESLLLGNADPTDVQKVFGLDPKVLDIFSELFFDVTKFQSKLDVVSYLENYPEGMGKGLKIRTYNLGPDFIYFKYGNVVPQTDTQKALIKHMFLTSAYKAIEANFNPMGSEVTKQALEWSKHMLKANAALESMVDNDIGHDFSLQKIITKRELAIPRLTPDESEDII